MTKRLPPEQQAKANDAWDAYFAAFAARGLPLPALSADEGLTARMECRAVAGRLEMRTVFGAGGNATPWYDPKEQIRAVMQDFYALRDAGLKATLRDDAWKSFNKPGAWGKGGE